MNIFYTTIGVVLIICKASSLIDLPWSVVTSFFWIPLIWDAVFVSTQKYEGE